MYCLNTKFFFSVLIDSGSRYEVAYPSGISHFIEKLGFCVSITLFQSFKIKTKIMNVCIFILNIFSFCCYSQPQSTRATMRFYKCWLVMEVYVTAKSQGKYNQSNLIWCLFAADSNFSKFPPPYPLPKMI